MTTTNDRSDRVNDTSQPYHYQPRDEVLKPTTTKEEALANALQSIKSEEMLKLKAEKKEAKKKRQKERKKAEKTNGNKVNETRLDSAISLNSDLTAETHGAETFEECESKSLESDDQEMQSDDEFLNVNAAFVKVSVKQIKNAISNKSSVPNTEKMKPSSDSMSKPAVKFVRPKITKDQTDTAVTLGIQSCNLALNNNDFVRAIDCLSQAIFLSPDDVRHFLNRSYCYLRSGQYSLALDDARSAKKNSQLPDDFAKAVAREGQALFGLQQYHEAEKCFEEILKLEQTSGFKNKWIFTELILARAFQLTNMGFSKIDALKAFQQCSTVVDAVTLLTSGNISSPTSDTGPNHLDFDNDDGDEIYSSDDEASSTILLSQLVSNIANESCYLENLRSHSASLKSQQCSSNLELTSTSKNASMESLPQNWDLICNSNSQWEVKHNQKSVATTSKGQIQKPLISDSSSIWVGSVDKSITDHQLHELFGVFGKINYIRRFANERNYVFIDFNNKKAATKALNNEKKLQINGIHLPVKPALGSYGKK